MATVSHLPHVLANVLVGEAAAALSEESERLPEVGTSFRDTTRVAGANPAIWGDIFATNREAVADEIAAVIERLRAAAELIRSGDAAAVGAWHRAAGEDRRRLLESDLAGGESASFGSASRTGPGRSPRSPSRSAARRSTSRTWPSTRLRTCAPARSRSGSPARPRPSAPPDVVRELGHVVSVVAAGGER